MLTIKRKWLKNWDYLRSYKLSIKYFRKRITGKIEELNNDEKVTAILVQLPLPEHISKENVMNKIKPEKMLMDLLHIISGNYFQEKFQQFILAPQKEYYYCLMNMELNLKENTL